MRRRKTDCPCFYLPGLMLLGLMLFLSSATVFSNHKSETITGKLSLIGNEPFTRLICRPEVGVSDRGQGTFQLEGDLLAELLNLQGARVLIEGSNTGRLSEYRLPIFLVTGYQLLAVNGSQPVVGVLTKTKSRLILQTEEGKFYLLSGQLLPMVEGYIGGKLWLTGEIKKGVFSWLTRKYELIPDAFGVIRTP